MNKRERDAARAAAAIARKLKKTLLKKTFKHVLETAKTAVLLAGRFGADRHRAKIAGLLHDCVKYMDHAEMLAAMKKYGIKISGHDRKIPAIWHGIIGEKIAKEEFGIKDSQVLRAIKTHSTGGVRMSRLEKIIYVSDYIEPGREYRDSHELRKLLDEDITLDFLVLCVLKSKRRYLKKNEMLIHPVTEILLKRLKNSAKYNRNN